MNDGPGFEEVPELVGQCFSQQLSKDVSRSVSSLALEALGDNMTEDELREHSLGLIGLLPAIILKKSKYENWN